MKFKNNIKNIRARNLISLLQALNYSDFCGKKKKYTNTDGLQITVTMMDDNYSYFFQRLHR